MIKITTENDIDAIANEWLAYLKSFLDTKKRDKYLETLESVLKDKDISNINEASIIFKEYLNNIDDYILANENNLENISKKNIENEIVKSAIKELFTQIYNDFTKHPVKKKKTAYYFFEKLNIRTCPYCNRQYTFTIDKVDDNNFSTRPEYDHFYDKSEHPLLALSFYNLVPSCHTCNHGKSTKPAGLNPYFKNFESKFVIDDKYGKKMNAAQIRNIKNVFDFEIGFDKPSGDKKVSKENINIETFGLKQLYNEHKDYVLELVEKATAYDSITIQGLIDGFQGIITTKQQAYDFVWGKHLDDAEHDKRPLSKLTKDILEELGIER